MRIILVTFILSASYCFAQQIDYNTKKGFIAGGYDVVAYFNNDAIEGNKNFIATYHGVKYKFYSQKSLEMFKANPKKFIPQYGGYCAYAVAANNEKVSVDPKTYEIRDGKLYLFYNAWGTNTLELWLKEDVKGLQEKGDKNWVDLKYMK